ncbi:MAG: isochorismatase family protein [Planctomycetota bacterium]|jgi:nicotinamidase-related amidase
MSIGKPKVMCIVSLLMSVILLSNFTAASQDTLILTARSRAETPEAGGELMVLYNRLEPEPSQTAIIICDMWHRHWCRGATRRVAELAPRMNEVIVIARDKGVLIIHAPSGTVEHYANHPARKRAQNAPKAANLPGDIAKWCKWIDKAEKTVYPIDQSEGGCDCQPKCEKGSPWRKQIDTLQIRDQDAISDSGVEIWNLLEHRGIDTVILMGVHTNMCVLGRPFGLRNMARYGKNVVLMRDLTDTMYNSRMRPFVSHFTGTELIIEHIEKLVCPTITSTALRASIRPPGHCRSLPLNWKSNTACPARYFRAARKGAAKGGTTFRAWRL